MTHPVDNIILLLGRYHVVRCILILRLILGCTQVNGNLIQTHVKLTLLKWL